MTLINGKNHTVVVLCITIQTNCTMSMSLYPEERVMITRMQHQFVLKFLHNREHIGNLACAYVLWEGGQKFCSGYVLKGILP